MIESAKALASSDLKGVTWRKSSRSAPNGQCVEVGFVLRDGGHVATRDSKDAAGPALVFGDTAWAGFLCALKRGDLDPR